jgi:membrane protease YdiL (CAAX protease family)
LPCSSSRHAQSFGTFSHDGARRLLWGFWHLGYSVNAEKAVIDYFEFGLGMIELPLYSLLIAWVMERSNRSLAVALLFHAGGHLDHIERDPGATPLLHL